MNKYLESGKSDQLKEHFDYHGNLIDKWKNASLFWSMNWSHPFLLHFAFFLLVLNN